MSANRVSPQDSRRDTLGVAPIPFSFRRVWPACVAAILALACIPFSETVHSVVYGFLTGLPLDEFFSTSKQFAGATCIVAMVAAIWTLDVPRRRALVVLLIALGISAATNETIKQITGRARPEQSVLLNGKDMRKTQQYILEHPGTPVRAERVDQWMAFKPHRPIFDADFASFPSGHANTAFLFAAFLLILYPRGRWIWFVIAAGCALARVRYRRHFPSDILMGGALGWTMAWWVFSWRWPVRVADWAFRKFGLDAGDS